MTIFARHVEDGTVAWDYQMTPFDQWDYDGVNENILVDFPNIDGKPVKALVHFDRNGFAYVLDRSDGELLRANKFVAVNWAERIDLKTGRPVKVYEHSPLKIGVNTQACPSAMGGKDQQPMRGRSQGSEQILLLDQQLVHGRRAAAARELPARYRLCLRQRLHV